MFNLLFARTFLIVGGMLIITAITSRINKAFETAWEMWLTIIGTFALLFGILFFANVYPYNLILVALFSGLVGWEIGPTIQFYGQKFRRKKYAKSHNLILEKNGLLNEEQEKIFAHDSNTEQYADEWHDVVFQAIFATAMAVLATASLVFLTSINFSFLGGLLFIALIILILMGLANLIFFHSSIFSLIRAYIGVVIFTLYLLYDFDRLEKMATDQTWAAAIDIAVNIYLDIINLFLDLLQILGDSN